MVARPLAERTHWNWGLYWLGYALGVGLTLMVVGVLLALGGDAGAVP